MVWLISIIVIIILYYCIDYLYKKYKEEIESIESIERQFSYIQIKISEMERKNMANERLISWLYDELTRKNLLSIEKEKKNEKGRK